MHTATRTTSKRARRFAGFVVALALTLVLVPSSSSAGGPPYPDASGDSSSAADIAGVTVLSDKTSGQVMFRVSGSNLSTSPSQVTFVAIDSDVNPATGNSNWNGADYAFAVDDGSYDFEHWSGSDWLEAPDSTVRVCCVHGGSSMTFSVNRSEIGNTSEFNFMASTFNTDTHATDDAPDDGMYNYSADASGPDIQGVTLRTTPSSGPKAGKRFVVTPVGLKLPPNGAIITISPPPDSYTCRATIKGRQVAGAGTGGCTLRLAKKSRTRQLHVVVTVSYEGATKSVPFTFVVS
jgi:hypothetical protein